MEESEKDELLTAEEVAKCLRVHRYTVYELLKCGRLEGFQLRTRWRIRKGSLNKFISEYNKPDEKEIMK